MCGLESVRYRTVQFPAASYNKEKADFPFVFFRFQVQVSCWKVICIRPISDDYDSQHYSTFSNNFRLENKYSNNNGQPF